MFGSCFRKIAVVVSDLVFFVCLFFVFSKSIVSFRDIQTNAFQFTVRLQSGYHIYSEHNDLRSDSQVINCNYRFCDDYLICFHR